MKNSTISWGKNVSQNPTVFLHAFIYIALLVVLASWQKLGLFETFGFLFISITSFQYYKGRMDIDISENKINQLLFNSEAAFLSCSLLVAFEFVYQGIIIFKQYPVTGIWGLALGLGLAGYCYRLGINIAKRNDKIDKESKQRIE